MEKLNIGWLLHYGFKLSSASQYYNEYEIASNEPHRHIIIRGNDNGVFTLFNHSECDSSQKQFIMRIQYCEEVMQYFNLLLNSLDIKKEYYGL